jgi:hypothetical protein
MMTNICIDFSRYANFAPAGTPRDVAELIRLPVKPCALRPV